jgi:hypothetical protein
MTILTRLRKLSMSEPAKVLLMAAGAFGCMAVAIIYKDLAAAFWSGVFFTALEVKRQLLFGKDK